MTPPPIRAGKLAALAVAGALMTGCPTGHDMAHAANAPRTEAVQYPWQGTDDEVVVNLAIGSLHHSMLNWLTTERGIHAETLLVSIGAIAGFAAQSAAFERIRKRDIDGVDKAMEGEALTRLLQERGLAVVVTTKSGETYYFGDLINGYLVQQKTTRSPSLYAILAGAAISAGVKAEDLPDVRPLFAHAAKTVGTPDYGVLHPPQNLVPQLTPRQALEQFWPRVKFIFERTDGQRVVDSAKGRNVRAEYWPLITALVARKFLLMAQDTIEPRTGLALMMESAIVMSKVDPKTVP